MNIVSKTFFLSIILFNFFNSQIQADSTNRIYGVITNHTTGQPIPDANIVIDKLVLLGTPIQSETSNLIYSKIFNKIYNIYSRGDPIQIIDIISTKDSISKRKFRVRNKNSKRKQENTLEYLPKKLVQIEVKFKKTKPLHNELWFWGEKYNFMYRKKIPIYPYPILSFIPTITNTIEKCLHDSQNIILTIKKNKNNLKFHFKNQNHPNQKYNYSANFPLNYNL